MNRKPLTITLSLLLAGSSFVTGCAGSRKSGWTEINAPSSAPPVPPAKPTPLDPALRSTAEREIRQSFSSSDPRIRANAMEAAQLTLGRGATDLIAAGMNDKNPIVRFAALMAAGKLRLTSLHDRALELADDPSVKVQLGSRFALHRMGDTHLSQDLVQMAKDPNPRSREDVAFVLGQLGETSALKILRRMSTDPDTDVRLQVADSMWRLGDEQGLEKLVAGLVSRAPDLQMLSLIAMVGPKDARVAEYVRGKLVAPYPEVGLVAARSLGELGLDNGYGLAMQYLASEAPRQRFLAAIALGVIGRSDAQPSLAPLLKDEDARVRLAAATAILQLRPPPASASLSRN
jgi:HEAT repeat protein